MTNLTNKMFTNKMFQIAIKIANTNKRREECKDLIKDDFFRILSRYANIFCNSENFQPDITYIQYNNLIIEINKIKKYAEEMQIDTNTLDDVLTKYRENIIKILKNKLQQKFCIEPIKNILKHDPKPLELIREVINYLLHQDIYNILKILNNIKTKLKCISVEASYGNGQLINIKIKDLLKEIIIVFLNICKSDNCILINKNIFPFFFNSDNNKMQTNYIWCTLTEYFPENGIEISPKEFRKSTDLLKEINTRINKIFETIV